jgi:hypothetical protein
MPYFLLSAYQHSQLVIPVSTKQEFQITFNTRVRRKKATKKAEKSALNELGLKLSCQFSSWPCQENPNLERMIRKQICLHVVCNLYAQITQYKRCGCVSECVCGALACNKTDAFWKEGKWFVCLL